MAGPAQVYALRKRLDATFARVAALKETDLEVQSDFARYLCVLVSGYVETVIAQIAIEHCERRAQVTVTNYAGAQLARVQNVNADRLLQTVGYFNPAWRHELEAFIDGPRKDALDSVIALRNEIAHGKHVGVTYGRIRDYYALIREVVDFIEAKFA
jgi:hypothetical protein